uniref:hypothetical protein n=1 Tax=Paractinoplanes polyasparticus TaxID=2856853 RepID=UPI001C840E02|nr:hypothetical protein [Actinoplanes polyasparticus]
MADVWAAAAAVAVGVFGWLMAHSLNFWLIAHSHHGVLSGPAHHVHEFTAAAAVLTGGLAGASLIAVVVSSALGPPARAVSRRRRCHLVRLAAGLSTVAFIAADALEHAALGVDSTPPSVYVTGLLLHAAFGAGTSLYSLRFTDGVRSLVRPHVTRWATPLVPQPAALRWPRRWRRFLWAYALAGRGPPIG